MSLGLDNTAAGACLRPGNNVTRPGYQRCHRYNHDNIVSTLTLLPLLVSQITSHLVNLPNNMVVMFHPHRVMVMFLNYHRVMMVMVMVFFNNHLSLLLNHYWTVRCNFSVVRAELGHCYHCRRLGFVYLFAVVFGTGSAYFGNFIGISF